MAQVESTIDAYDHEGAIEAAVQTVLAANGLKNVFISSDIGIARPRPRVEVQFTVGDEADHHELVDNNMIANAWRGTLMLQIIVNSDKHEELRQLRADCRYIASKWQSDIDAELELICINWVKTAPSSPLLIELEKGYLAATLRWDVLYSLLPGTLQELAAIQP